MNITRKIRQNKDGSALLTVLLVVLISTIMVGSFFNMSSQRSFMAKKLTNRTRAISIAEAGVHVAYSILATNFEARSSDDAFPETAYAGGVYDVTITSIGDDIAVIKSAGTYGDVTEMTILDVRKEGTISGGSGGGAIPGTAWECSVFASGKITVNGNGNIQGVTHCNNDFRANGNMDWGTVASNVTITTGNNFKGNGNIIIHGSVEAATKISLNGSCTIDYISSPITYYSHWTCNIGEEHSDPPIYPIRPFPELDLTPYYQIALENGQVINQNKTYNGNNDLGNIPGGVLWINGTVRINGTFSMHGMLIATGYIKLNGECYHYKSPNGFCGILSRDSYVNVNGNHDIYGVIYSRENLRLNGNGNIFGQILCDGNINMNGNYGVVSYVYSDPGGGGGGGTPPSDGYVIKAAAWQR